MLCFAFQLNRLFFAVIQMKRLFITKNRETLSNLLIQLGRNVMCEYKRKNVHTRTKMSLE